MNMTTWNIYVLLNFTALIAPIIILLRRKYITGDYLPFVLASFLAAANEILSYCLISAGKTNTLTSNIYVLLEFFLWLWQFYKWSAAPGAMFGLFGLLALSAWCLGNWFIEFPTGSNSLFRIVTSIMMLFLAIDTINRKLVGSRLSLLPNPVLLVCSGILLYFGFKAFAETFLLVGTGFAGDFYKFLVFCLSAVNAITNLLFAIALICIPQKKEFTWPSYWHSDY